MIIAQIGSNKGYDELTGLIENSLGKSAVRKLILVEPLDVHHDSLRKCYDGLPYVIEQLAISDSETSKTLTFYYHTEDGPGYEVSSLKKEHILKHSRYTEDGLREVAVPCLTLNQLLEKHGAYTVDILFIDAEGFDDKIISSINFEKYNVINIIYENLHINKRPTIELLHSKGYDIQPRWGLNGWSTLAFKRGFDQHPSTIILRSLPVDRKRPFRRIIKRLKNIFRS
jgi:FkbM family methyltransferase